MYINHEIGSFGEKIANKYLESIGYEILEKNFTCKQGEIDIIAKDKHEIVFIEVKTRTSTKYGKPAEAVNNTKQKHIYNSAKYYLYKNNKENIFVRFDVLEIYLSKTKIKINHIKQVI